MSSIDQDLQVLREQLGVGAIQRAYRGLLAYMAGLRTHFANQLGEAAVSGFYQGTMDMTYFALFPESLRRLDLKIAIVFNYEAFRFEAWLAARNRKLQRQYWEAFQRGDWGEYRVTAPAAGIDSILECDLATEFELGSPDSLTARIEKGTAAFIERIERFLAQHPPAVSGGLQ